MVGRRYEFPLPQRERAKLEALERRFDVLVLSSGRDTSRDERFRLLPPVRPRLLDGPAFYATLPARLARELRRFRPDAVLVQGTHETAAALLARLFVSRETKIILDLHGDPRQATRLYGSRARRLFDPLGDRISEAALRRADGIRTISGFTSGIVRARGREPDAVFPALVDVDAFVDSPPAPLPERPSLLFIGVLERYKNVDGLAAAWRHLAAQLPAAELRVVGRGRLAEVVAGLPQASWTPSLPNAAVPRALDDAWALALPSRSEGLPRVAIEAFARGRAVVGSRRGGIPDIVEHDRNGLLVDDPEDAEAVAAAFARLLSDRALAERLGAAAREDVSRWTATPEEFAERTAALVRAVLAG
jgi:glycosyltransferase involved in cell wall biosynthesis